MTFRTSLPFLDADTDNKRAAGLLSDAKAKFGFVPNMYRAMANAPGLLSTYFFASARFREESSFTAIEQEIIALSVSFENDCTYCVAARQARLDQRRGCKDIPRRGLRRGANPRNHPGNRVQDDQQLHQPSLRHTVGRSVQGPRLAEAFLRITPGHAQ